MRFKIPSNHVEGAKRWLEDAEKVQSARRKSNDGLKALNSLNVDSLGSPRSPVRVFLMTLLEFIGPYKSLNHFAVEFSEIRPQSRLSKEE
jgi:hypothetical protein